MESLVREIFHSFSPSSQATAKELSELRPQSCRTSPWSQLHGRENDDWKQLCEWPTSLKIDPWKRRFLIPIGNHHF